MKQHWKFAGLMVVISVALWVVAPYGQGTLMPNPKFQGFDDNGDPLSGGKLYSYAAGTTNLQDTYSDSALATENDNPIVLDSAGRATVYLDPELSYKFTLTDADDAEIWTQDNIVGSLSGVLAVTASDTRGLQISRASADAGLSIASTGGSGKTYGIVSNTSGSLILRDDADGTPNITFASGNTITLTATSGVTVTGDLTVSGSLASTSQAGFLAYNSATDDDTTTETVEFDAEVYDDGNVFNNTTDTFTAPSSGRYLLCTQVLGSPGSLSTFPTIVTIVTSNRSYFSYTSVRDDIAPDQYFTNKCVIADMEAADTATVTATPSGVGSNMDITGGGSTVTYFSGRKLL